jgi:hypothetical protein
VKLVKRGAFALMLLSFVATARCYHTDFASAVGGLPVVGAMVVPPPKTPAYIEAIGRPAPVDALPDPQVETWWPANPEDATSTLSQARTWLVAAQTPAGWAALCGAASRAVGAERTVEPVQLAGLACSDEPTVTRLQLFAVLVLRLDPETQLYLAGAPGSSRADIESTLAQIRVECTAGYASRALFVPAVGVACALPDAPGAGRDGDAVAFLQDVVDTYQALAETIVELSPKTAAEPTFFGAAGG